MNKYTEAMQLLNKHFDLALEAPDGIKKLRELILTLAMQGKLVPQDPNDQPASELLKEIQAEKNRLIKEGKIRKQEALPPIKPEEIPYEIPKGWEWVRLKTIGEINPKNIADDNVEVGFVPMPCIFAEYGKKHIFENKKWGEIKKGYTHLANMDVVLAKITPCFENGKSCIIENLPHGVGAGTTELHVFRNLYKCIYPMYLLAYIKNPKYINEGITKMTGSAGQKRVPTEFFTMKPFPLPPITEQKRIVAKIDELMALCDELEAHKKKRDAMRLTVHTAAMNKLLTAQDKTAFDGAWGFITKKFDTLYAVPENVAELKKAILQLAVMGKLVPQDPHDQPASELLKEIQAEKNRLIKEGKIRKQEALPPIKPEDIEFSIPLNWEICTLSDLSIINGGYAFKSSFYVQNGIRVIRISDFNESGFVNDSIVRYTYSSELEQFRLEENDILMAMTGGTVGKNFHVKKINEDMVVNQRVATIKVFKIIDNDYIYRVINSKYIQKIIQDQKNSTNDNISMSDIQRFFIPLPPLAEQKRIVAKIDELMVLCDELEKRIEESSEKQAAILDAVVARI